MRRTVAAMLTAGVFLFGKAASAHRIDEYLQATIVSLEPHRMQASMRLIPGVLVSSSVVVQIDSNGDGVFSESEERAYAQRVLGDQSITIDGQGVEPRLVSCSFPQPAQLRDGTAEIHIEYAADLPSGGAYRSLVLANHPLSHASVFLVNVTVPETRDLEILAQKRDGRQTRYEVDYRQTGSAAALPRTAWNLPELMNGAPFASLFHLGMRHIAEGTDHLLFLLTLLLPAPLLVFHSRWGQAAGARQSLLRIVGIVTAFTIGHSITLTLAAFGALHVPSRPVEVLIAASILVSAVHALRPIVPGKEALIAAAFGLIHGLAFAATLDLLGFGRWQRVAGIFAFNLGIEATQMLVIAAVLPSLILMSRTPAYPVLRIGGAIFAVAASCGWLVERLFHVPTPVDVIMNGFARQAPWMAATLFVLSVAARLLLVSRGRQAPQAELAPERSLTPTPLR